MTDVIIIGAGPAGLSAAIACREANLDVIVMDEFMKPGGRLLGQLHEEPNGIWWNGIEETKKLVSRIDQLGAKIQCGTSVHHIEKMNLGFGVHTNKGLFIAKHLLIATGAAEAPAPIPGWTLPGVMSIGAAQVMTNVHRVRVGKKGVVVGVNVLSAAIARELQLAGIELHCMLLPAINSITKNQGDPRKVLEALMRIAHLAPSAFIRYGSKLVKFAWMHDLILRFFPKQGIKMWGLPIHLRKAVISINGNKQVESVTMCDITADGERVQGSDQTIELDFVCIAGGLYPLAELAAVAGCPFQYVEELGGHVPVHNERMETPLEGLFVAGNITGIESAKVARSQGTLAGLSIVKRSKELENIEQSNAAQSTLEETEQSILEAMEQRILEAMDQVKLTRAAATIQFHPGIAAGRDKMEIAFQQQKM